MNVILCIKPIKAELVYPNERRNEKFVISPYDLKALEDCVKLRKTAAVHIRVIIMGSETARETAVKALAIGADEAYLLSDRTFGGSDTVATSYILSRALLKLGDYDLVICGEKSIDGETGQVGVGLAERLGLNCISQVQHISSASDNQITLIKDSGLYQETAAVKIPLLVTYRGFVMERGNVSLLAIKKARRKEIIVWNADDLQTESTMCGLAGSKTKVLEIKNDLKKKSSHLIDGDIRSKADELLHIIKHKKRRCAT